VYLIAQSGPILANESTGARGLWRRDTMLTLMTKKNEYTARGQRASARSMTSFGRIEFFLDQRKGRGRLR